MRLIAIYSLLFFRSSTAALPLSAEFDAPRSVYIHIPFCRRRCFYCDFPIHVVGDSPSYASKSLEPYVKAIEREIAATAKALSGTIAPSAGLETVYFGGGTPSLCPPHLIRSLVDTLRETFSIVPSPEITLEMDPGTFDEAKLLGYLDAGINRVNMGMQSFDAGLLTACGRAHSLDDAFRALEILSKLNFKNFGMDLIAGLPNQSLQQWTTSLHHAVSSGAAHISVYDLQIEDRTAFGSWYKAGKLPVPSDAVGADMFAAASSTLRSHGYLHYEISNYALEGFESRHNMAYWKNEPYFAFGNGAASHINRHRFTRPRRLTEYYKWLDALCEERDFAKSTQFSASTRESVALDRLMLGLRTSDGVDLAELERFAGIDGLADTIVSAVEPCIVDGLIKLGDGKRVALTDPRGMLLSNSVISDIFLQLGHF